jgi:N-acetylmuramoyl-L-alanine amidase
LHSDVRGDNDSGDACPRSRSAPGFAVLWSDAADDALDDRRLGLARAMARQLQRMGVLPYSGADYRGMYAADTTPGVFVDRHEPQERIFVLHKPTMPSIIIETHNAWDDREVARWDQKQTREAFMAAVVTALVDALHDR